MAVLGRQLAVAAAVAICLASSAPGHAQGFFQSLFGFSSPEQRPTAPANPALPPSYRAPIFQPQSPREDAPANRADSGTYRTLCVRMCDGYYFPMSGSASRRTFARDAARCSASCGSEARLFYHAASSGDAATMIDLSGRAYSRLPNAFKYRKTLVSGCACKPEPWAASELARHRQYAAAETVARSQAAGTADGNKPGAAIPATATTSVDVTNPAANSQSATTTVAAVTVAPQDAQQADAPEERPPAPKRAKRIADTNDMPRRSDRSAHAQRQITPKPAPTGFFGLGAPKQRWPGD